MTDAPTTTHPPVTRIRLDDVALADLAAALKGSYVLTGDDQTHVLIGADESLTDCLDRLGGGATSPADAIDALIAEVQYLRALHPDDPRPFGLMPRTPLRGAPIFPLAKDGLTRDGNHIVALTHADHPGRRVVARVIPTGTATWAVAVWTATGWATVADDIPADHYGTAAWAAYDVLYGED